jgi:hypothetical protein
MQILPLPASTTAEDLAVEWGQRQTHHQPVDQLFGRLWSPLHHGQRITTIRKSTMSEPSNEGDLATVMQQIKDFANGRPVRLLTRKANSKRDSAVAYDTVFPQNVEFGTLQVSMRCDGNEVVAAVNVLESNKVHEDYWAK